MSEFGQSQQQRYDNIERRQNRADTIGNNPLCTPIPVSSQNEAYQYGEYPDQPQYP
ncbi:MAG: hypothetical protein U1E91_01050 [Moraxella sp.]